MCSYHLNFAEDAKKIKTTPLKTEKIVKNEKNIKNDDVNATPKAKKNLKEKLPDYETKMQALTGCYFIFEKMIAENKQNFADFINNHSLNKTELYIRVRLDHIAKCLMKIGDFNVSKV